MTRKIFKKLTLCAVFVLLAIFVFNIPVTTRQGINGVVFTRKIPLYVKISGFLYRDYQYKRLSENITSGIKGDIDKINALYDWTIDNIRKPPVGFPIIDDHIWDIIVRRYGLSDQMADVFTTLASYAGYEAFWQKLYAGKIKKPIVLSFVGIGDNRYVFDIYGRKGFMSKEDLAAPTRYGPTYAEYLQMMSEIKLTPRTSRPDKQKIFPRLKYEFNKIFGIKNDKQ